jgi:formylglycine-generating enzyme required for sulfatase activity
MNQCNDDVVLSAMGWYCYNNTPNGTKPVAQKTPNDWGLYDMHGNVYEWCSDWIGIYPSGSVIDPTGPASGSQRVMRGGDFGGEARDSRCAQREDDYPQWNDMGDVGFRLCRQTGH